MPEKSPFHPKSLEDLIPYIKTAGEDSNFDAKGPMLWDGAESSAALTKDIIAFANSRDGGVIVIGKEEPSPGEFVFSGLSRIQADSFDTTKVATWVNNHCKPSINLVCNRVQYNGVEFIVLTIGEFDDIPVLCTKQYVVPNNKDEKQSKKKPKVILRKGEIYVRSVNAASTPMSTIEELRTLIGIATTKRADEMLSMFQSMMKGQPFFESKQASDPYKLEREKVLETLGNELKGKVELGCWTLICHPMTHNPSRWDEANKLKDILKKSVVRLRNQFPPINNDLHNLEWGICNEAFGNAFGFTRSGLFIAMRLFQENSMVYENPWPAFRDIPVEKWIDFDLNLKIIVEFFLFLKRLVEEYEVGEEIYVELVAGPLMERKLVSMQTTNHLEPSDPCRSGEFRYDKIYRVESLRASWEEPCVKVLCRFFELFNFDADRDLESIMSDMVESFKHRRFI